VLVTLMGLMVMPAAAQASFFDDGRWYMDSDQWMTYSSDADGTVLFDLDNRLNFTANGWGDGRRAFRCYGSNWQLDLNYDFSFSANFHYEHTGTFDTDEGDLDIGLVSFYPELGQIEPTHVFEMSVENQFYGQYGPAVDKYDFFKNTPGGEEESEELRWSSDGRLSVVYDSSTEELKLRASEEIGGVLTEVAGETYTGLKTGLGLSELRVYLGGGSEGAQFSYGDAYLTDFQMNGTVTPEPLSCLLFASGAGLIGFVRSRKKKTSVV
jgi:hypothetical protein